MLLDRAERTILVVCHEIPVRYALNAAGGSDELDGPDHSIPNATPYLFDEESLARAAAGSSGSPAERNHPFGEKGAARPAANCDAPRR